MKMMSENEKYFVSLGMRTYGGVFASKLGEALVHANVNNQEKIKSTWSELWSQYLDMGKKIHLKMKKQMDGRVK